MIRWLRVVWPPEWALATAMIFWMAAEGVCAFVESLAGSVYLSLDCDYVPLMVVGMTASLYGLFRVAAFHPICRPGYYQWLRETPWTAKKPLPLGPVHLSWQDVTLVAFMIGICWPRAGWQALSIALAFMLAYVIALGLANLACGERRGAYALAFWFGIVFLLRHNDWGLFGALGVAYGLAYLGLRVVLAQFPWTTTLAGKSLQDFSKDRSLGWPFDRLGPRSREDCSIARNDALLVGVVMGWWALVLHTLCQNKLDEMTGFVICWVIIVSGAIVRVVLYLSGMEPPLNIIGRIALFRWVIPGFDKVLLAPALAILISMSPIYTQDVLPPIWGTPLVFLAGWWVLLGMGPRVQDWRLTGNNRIAMSPWSKANLTT